ERKRREDDIRRLNAQLERRTLEVEASNKELEAFAYSVSHDLRAPLRHIAAYAELLQRTASSVLNERSRRQLTYLLEAVTRMGALIDDLLAFSRIGRAETRMTLVSLGEVLREVLREMERDTNGRDIAWKVGEPLPSVHGDRSMLKLALFNLVSNAVKFTRTRPRAEIEIGCGHGARDEVVVFVRDNGVGFDMEYANKLFGVFQRLHLPEEFEGTGIGLATVQRIIVRHGGRVWAEGVVDGGATFYFALPAR
ncbi:MAG TPA: ATP-binding protein, partial [Myxococcota bacterium]|nr:ATP-binding protein [Myxococcota bacterium]